MKTMRLSPNFSLNEFLRSQTATRKGFDEQFSPPKTIIDALKSLCVNLLEPLRLLYEAPLFISSGYRCSRLNTAVGGVETSQHLTGEAVDLDFGSKEANERIFKLIVLWHQKGWIQFDQLINEYDYSWIHISYRRTGVNRNQIISIQ